MINRRGFTAGLLSLIAAPAVVKAASLMPIKGYNLVIRPDWCPEGWLPCVGQTIASEQFPQLFNVQQVNGRKFIPIFNGVEKATLRNLGVLSYTHRDLVDPPPDADRLQSYMDDMRGIKNINIIAIEAQRWPNGRIAPAGFCSTMKVSQSQFEEYYGTAS